MSISKDDLLKRREEIVSDYNKAVEEITGKSPTENIKSLTDSKKSKIDKEQNYDEFFALVKNRIEKTSKIINLANQ